MSKVSVCVTNWNYGKYLKKALQSIWDQTYKDFNWYIVDDGSTDESLVIYEDLPAWYVYRHEKQEGATKAYQRGLDLCQTDWIIYLDADDQLFPNYIEETMRVAAEQNVPWVYTDFQYMDENSAPQGRINFLEKFDPHYLQISNFIHSACLIKAEIIRQAGGWQEHKLEDWDLWKRISALGYKAAKAKDTCLLYRKHGLSRMNGGRGK